MRGELDAISVKIDKVPTLVDKIVSDAQKPQDNPALSELSTELAQTRDALESKLARLEEFSNQAPLLPEPDPESPKPMTPFPNLPPPSNL